MLNNFHRIELPTTIYMYIIKYSLQEYFMRLTFVVLHDYENILTTKISLFTVLQLFIGVVGAWDPLVSLFQHSTFLCLAGLLWLLVPHLFGTSPLGAPDRVKVTNVPPTAGNG